MKGVVCKINERRGMIAIKTENCDYSICEFIGGFSGEFELEDIVTWKEDTDLGDTVVRNITQDIRVDVYFQNHLIGESNLNQQLLL